MPSPRLHSSTSALNERFAAVRERLEVPRSFEAEVEALAAKRAATGVPDHPNDRRDLPLVAVDPPGATDIDQAFSLSTSDTGYRFNYAIADLSSWIEPGDAIDVAARGRGVTVYCPDTRTPLHPTAISEGVASLLPGVDRLALLWTIELDHAGEVTGANLERALIRNTAALTYSDVQAKLDEGGANNNIQLLAEVGKLRTALEIQRGGVSLNLPEQEIRKTAQGYELGFDKTLDVERYNAQLSLCCGMAAAQIMVDAGFGILRTLPAADDETADALRMMSEGLGVSWGVGVTYSQWARALSGANAAEVALMNAAARSFRGAGYLAFDGDLIDDHQHHAIAAPYAHVTAPLRRLVDRFANECVLAACNSRRPDGWVLDALGVVPGLMGAATQRSSAVERGCTDIVEAAILSTRMGETFEASVVSNKKGASVIQIAEPAIVASLPGGDLAPGSTISVRLIRVDLDAGEVEFERAV